MSDDLIDDERVKCAWCGDWFNNTAEEGAYYPYCSSLCAAHAQVDSEEDK